MKRNMLISTVWWSAWVVKYVGEPFKAQWSL